MSQQSNGEQKAFASGSWYPSEEEKDETCLMAKESNEVPSDSLYYSSSSLDDESLSLEYNKLCKIILKVINKNKFLKSKIGILEKGTLDLKEKIIRLEKWKEAIIEYELCVSLQMLVDKQDSIIGRLTTHRLDDIIDTQQVK